MTDRRFSILLTLLVLVLGPVAGGAFMHAQTPTDDPVKALVGHLDLEKYKATIKALTRFGDRLQGTDRNKAANEWIAAQLTSYGCVPERLSYVFMPASTAPAATTAPLPRQIRQRRSAPMAWADRGSAGARLGRPEAAQTTAPSAPNRTLHCGR